tara:strand:- start:685 stop:879 length:195 start_codon:yes stop_codon:yes gene_type:complete
MNSKKNSIPSLEEAVTELQALLVAPRYSTTKTSEEISREQAYYAGQAWFLVKLEQLASRYKKGE